MLQLFIFGKECLKIEYKVTHKAFYVSFKKYQKYMVPMGIFCVDSHPKYQLYPICYQKPPSELMIDEFFLR